MSAYHTNWREQERRIREARSMASRLGLRISNLRAPHGGHADLWVLAEPRSFDDVEAELLERMRQRKNFERHTYQTTHSPVHIDMEYVEDGDGECVPVQYVTVDVCRRCGAQVHDQAMHDAWHIWMQSLHKWMGDHQHDQTTPQNDFNRLRQRLGEKSNQQPLGNEGSVEVVPERATETVARRRWRVQDALKSLGATTSPAKLARHLHMDAWEVREHLRALEVTGLNTVAPKEDR